MAKKKISIRHRNARGRFSKRGKRERVYSHAKTILRKIAKREREQKKKEKKKRKKLPPPKTPARSQEFLVIFERGGYDDVVFSAVAFEPDEAIGYVRNEILNTENGKKLLRAFSVNAIPFNPPRWNKNIGEVNDRE